MRKLETYGTIKNGILKISYRDKFAQNIKLFDDCRIKLTVQKLYKKRSTKTYRDDGSEGNGQNGYYWTIIVSEFCDGFTQITGEQIINKRAHEILKAKCNFKELVNHKTGEIITIPLSTSNLNTVEFEEYCERCRAFIFEWMGKTIPLPNEQSELEFTTN